MPFTADPERLSYPEPMPPEPRRAAPAFAAFENTLTARATAATRLAEVAASAEERPLAEAAPAPRPAATTEAIASEAGDPLPAEESAVEQTESEQTVADLPVAEAHTSIPERSGEPLRAPAAGNEEYDFDLLIERLAAGPSHGGRCVLVVETLPQAGSSRSLAENLAAVLSRHAPTLGVTVNGRNTADVTSGPGLSDLVAGEAAFPDVIHPVTGTRLHRIGSGRASADLLLDEPEGVAICFNAMAQAYDWVICRLDATTGESTEALLSTIAACMDSVVIASAAQADDAGLVALYRLAESAGAGQVLVAHDLGSAWDGGPSEPEMELRLSA